MKTKKQLIHSISLISENEDTFTLDNGKIYPIPMHVKRMKNFPDIYRQLLFTHQLWLMQQQVPYSR